MSVTQTARYFWKSGSTLQKSYVLIDRVSAREIATVTYLNTMRKWRWVRKTSVLLHGVQPADGVCKRLNDAKKWVETGLPLDLVGCL
jgi:hypothetical protein